MLKIATRITELSFHNLMYVYEDSNRLNAEDFYTHKDADDQLHQVHQDFYQYLSSVFFKQPDSYYALWIIEGRYTAASRMEPYRDGYLLCALETAPEARRKGYAEALVTAVLKQAGEKSHKKIYSHVAKSNTASIKLHQKCGFKLHKDYAVYSDGSVMHNHVTFLYELITPET